MMINFCVDNVFNALFSEPIVMSIQEGTGVGKRRRTFRRFF